MLHTFGHEDGSCRVTPSLGAFDASDVISLWCYIVLSSPEMNILINASSSVLSFGHKTYQGVYLPYSVFFVAPG